MPEAPLEGFAESTFTHDGISRPVFRGGAGPAVIVIHEVPGLHPEAIAPGRRAVDAGFTVYMPSLFGTPASPSAGVTRCARSHVRNAREFVTMATDRTSPIIGWLRRLAADAHAECGGPGSEPSGCASPGGSRFGMMVDETMLAPVLSQPSLPFPIGNKRKLSVGISDADFDQVKERAKQARAYSVSGSPPTRRFLLNASRPCAASWAMLSSRWRSTRPAATLTGSRSERTRCSRSTVDEPGHPTRTALEQVLAFLQERLLTTG